MLDALGFSPIEVAVYDLLVSRGRATLDEVLAPGPAEPRRQALDTLESKGLVRRLAGADQEYVVAPPEQAIEVLIAEQMSALQVVRAHSAELAARVRRATQQRDPTELIEVVSGEGAARQLFLQVVKTARKELAVFDRPPYAITLDDATSEEVIKDQAERISTDGLALRTVFDRSLLEDPAQVHRILQGVAGGEEARIASVPLKLALVDREWGMLPLVHADGKTPEAAVIVRPSILLDSLIALFDSVWQQAAEVKTKSGDLTLPDGEVAEPRRLARLLAAGMTDVSIAHHLGISERTVRRRIKDLMKELRVHSRFQAGVRAAEEGWL